MVRREKWLTDGRVIPDGKSGRRLKRKRADYVLYYGRDLPIAIVEAKHKFKDALDGIDQAIEYAKMLGVKFAYSTNGEDIVEWDLIQDHGNDKLKSFPTPEELWSRLNPEDKVPEEEKKIMLEQFNRQSNSPEGGIMEPRYYQERAINSALSAILRNQKRILLSLATGTGKTYIAFQIAWKLWKSRKIEEKKPKILFLTDRDALLKQAYDKDFAPFENARKRIRGKMDDSHDVYFALYQALDVDKESSDEDLKETELYKQYKRDFFDYIIVDECHRGVSDDGNWRDILDYFNIAVHIGMTATPKLLTGENKGTYDYFGEPVYEYSLRQGIADGFLAPYYIERIVFNIDKTGYRPKKGEKDLRGRILEDKTYTVKDFDNHIYIESRQLEVAKHLFGFLKKNEQVNDKTILFCQNSTHAADMTQKIRNESKLGPEYCKRIVSDDGKLGKVSLEHFCNPKMKKPVIAVTAKLMSTGIDARTCKVIALDKNIESMTEFKQIIGRGTRLSESLGKFWFTIIDYRGVTNLFEDPAWDGPPMAQKPRVRKGGKRPKGIKIKHPRILGDEVFIEHRIVRVVDQSTGKTRVIKFEDYTRENVRAIVGKLAEDLHNVWIDFKNRRHFEDELQKAGITLNHIRQIVENYDKDIFDLLLHIAYDRNMKTRRQRVDNVRKKKFFLEKPENARKVLDVLLEHYADKGYKELELDQSRELLELEKFKEFGGLHGIIEEIFGGEKSFDQAISELIHGIYEAY